MLTKWDTESETLVPLRVLSFLESGFLWCGKHVYVFVLHYEFRAYYLQDLLMCIVLYIFTGVACLALDISIVAFPKYA